MFSSFRPLTTRQRYVKNTFEYLCSSQFPVTRIGEVSSTSMEYAVNFEMTMKIHVHGDCLSLLSVKDDGTLMLSAEDLVHVTLSCLAQRLCTLLDDVRPQSQKSVANIRLNAVQNDRPRMVNNLFQQLT